jgi:hypothetical protein
MALSSVVVVGMPLDPQWIFAREASTEGTGPGSHLRIITGVGFPGFFLKKPPVGANA